VLVSGEDGAEVAAARAGLLLALAGPEADAEMRLARLSGAEVRRDPALLLDAAKATGFFPGPRAVWVEDATDGVAPALAAALDAWREGDARIVLTGGALTAKGALRKLAEGRRDAVAITLYDDPPTEAEVAERLREAGLGAVTPEARDALVALAQGLPGGEMRGLLERLALHQAGAAEPLRVEAVEALSPREGADLDEVLAALTDGPPALLARRLAQVAAQGTGPVAVAIGAARHLRAVLAVASDPGGPQAGLAGLRPPVGGARRAAIERAARAWSRPALERALREVVALDLRLRGGRAGAPPERALLERTLLEVARLSSG
jgi:DNA polymerase-3 subunit delta